MRTSFHIKHASFRANFKYFKAIFLKLAYSLFSGPFPHKIFSHLLTGMLTQTISSMYLLSISIHLSSLHLSLSLTSLSTYLLLKGQSNSHQYQRMRELDEVSAEALNWGTLCHTRRRQGLWLHLSIVLPLVTFFHFDLLYHTYILQSRHFIVKACFCSCSFKTCVSIICFFLLQNFIVENLILIKCYF